MDSNLVQYASKMTNVNQSAACKEYVAKLVAPFALINCKSIRLAFWISNANQVAA